VFEVGEIQQVIIKQLLYSIQRTQAPPFSLGTTPKFGFENPLRFFNLLPHASLYFGSLFFNSASDCYWH
jgi:hypothetical protein